MKLLSAWKRKPAFRDPWRLDRPLIDLGNGEAITVGQSYEGLCVLGGPGAGKSSSSGFQLARAMLKAGYGALVMTAKIDEVDRWRRLAALSGRTNDLVVFDEPSGSAFNFLNYLASRQPPEAGFSNTLIFLLEELSELIERMSGLRQSRGDEQYWSQGRRLLMQNAIDLCMLGVGEVSIPYIVEIIRDAPRSLEEAASEQWRENSAVYQILKRAKQTPLSTAGRIDLLEVEAYFMRTFAGLAEKTRSIVESNVDGVLQLFTRGQLNRLYCKGTTCSPEDVLAGRIVIVNLPIKKHFGLGLVAQAIWKMCTQLRLEQRNALETRPCLIFMDECQSYLTMRDASFAATARSSLTCNLWLTQCVSNLQVALGADETGKAAVESLLGLAATKIFHANGDPITNQWASELIGKRRVRMRSSSIAHPPGMQFGMFPPSPQVSSSSSETMEFVVPAHEFAMLQKGGRPHSISEAMVFQAGRRFRSTGEPYCRVFFPQGF